jgi:uncharacterized protein (TIGR04255 family)
MNQNPKLTKAPIIETLFEVRFVPSMDYSFFVTELENRLTKEIEKTEQLVQDSFPEFPAFPGVPPLIRKRYHLINNQGLVQVGRGILSINQIKYDRFENFLNLIKKIMSIFAELEKNSVSKRFGLRYINKISLEKNWQDVLSVVIIPPDQIQNGLDSVYYKFVVNKEKEGKLQIVLANPVEQGSPLKEVVIDLDHYKDVDEPFKLDEIISWINEAHQTIYNTFISCLNPSFKKELE